MKELTIRLDRIEDAIQDIKLGKIIIVADDEDRENEGDMICASEAITPELVNFMIKEARAGPCRSDGHDGYRPGQIQRPRPLRLEALHSGR